MESKLIEAASSQGIWALLFIVLFIYTVRDGKQRESKYQSVIEKLSNIIEVEIKCLAEKIEHFSKKD